MSKQINVLSGILSGGTIAFHAVFAKAFRSIPVGVFLSQGYFWQENAKFRDKEKYKTVEGKTFFAMTAKEWFEETSLTQEQQTRVRETLVKHNVLIEWLTDNPAKLYFHIDLEVLVSVINQYLVSGISVSVDNRNKNRFKTQTRLGKKPKQDLVKNPNTSIVESLDSFESEGEGTLPPAPNPSNLQSQKKDRGLVAPAENPKTVKAEKKEKDFIPRGAAPADCDGSYGVGKIEFYPVRLDAKEIRGLVDLTETYPFGFCETCQGQKVVGGRNGLIECPTCEGTGLGTGRTESETPAELEDWAVNNILTNTPTHIVTETTEDPNIRITTGLNLSEPITKTVTFPHRVKRKNGRIEIPDEAAAEILPWATGDGAETVKSWYDRAFRQHSPKDVEDMVMRFSTVFLSSEKAAFRDMMETNPLSFFKRRFAGFVADQKQYDRNNAPKEGGQTRQNGQPHSALPRSLQNQVGK